MTLLTGEDYDRDIIAPGSRWGHFITFIDPNADNTYLAGELSKLAKHFNGEDNRIDFSVFNIDEDIRLKYTYECYAAPCSHYIDT